MPHCSHAALVRWTHSTLQSGYGARLLSPDMSAHALPDGTGLITLGDIDVGRWGEAATHPQLTGLLLTFIFTKA